MAANENSARLSGIQTHWTEVLNSTHGPQDLLLRYFGAAQRYLLAMLRDPVAAEELAQDFAVRFLRGDFRGADPRKGRFRDFLKTCLRNQVRDYWRRACKPGPVVLSEHVAQAAEDVESDRCFLAGWRELLLARAWQALAEYDQATGKPYGSVLRLRTDDPKRTAEQISQHLRREQNLQFTTGAVRQLLHRARERFARFLVEEVEQTVDRRDPKRLEEELLELEFWDYCRPWLQARTQS